MLLLHPWLASYVTPASGGASVCKRARLDGDRTGGDDGRDVAPAIAGDVLLDVWKTLEDKRKVVEAESLNTADSFYVSVRGGAWTAANRGKVFDCIAAQARGGTPRESCPTYGLSTGATFATERYDEPSAAIFAREWCNRMEYFYLVWLLQDLWEYRFTPADLQAYVPRDEFIDLF